jgi:tyrosine-protein kinase
VIGFGDDLDDFLLNRPPRPKSINDLLQHPGNYIIKKPLGYGGSSSVLQVRTLDSNHEFSVKCVNTPTDRQGLFWSEVETLYQLQHPCIVRIIGFARPTATQPGEIHFELAENNSLEKFMRTAQTRQFFTPTRLAIFVCGIVLGMDFVHSHEIIHGDLKPSNILVTHQGYALITDFGESRREKPEMTPETDAGGTVHYAAPERFSDTPLTTKVDVFSFGCILYEICVGRPVFPSDQTPLSVMKCITSGEMPSSLDHVGRCVKGIIEQCWAMNPDNRPSFAQILEEFQRVNYEFISGADANAVQGYAAKIIDWAKHGCN